MCANTEIEMKRLLVYLAGEVAFSFSLVNCVEERPWWPMQSPNKGRKKKAKG